MKATQEQLSIVEVAKVNKTLAIDAGAGSGKTHILGLMASSNPVKSLLIVFNKASQEDTAKRFAHIHNLEVRTFHSLAYRAVGVNYQHKLSRPKGRYVNVAGTGSEIAKYYGISPMSKKGGKVVGSSLIGLLAKQCVNCYEYSKDQHMNKSHLSTGFKECVDRYEVSENKLKKEVMEVAKLLWRDRSDVDSVVLATHDTYMKLFQLSKPDLGVEVIYYDEVQDAHPAALDIVCNQKSKLVLVGDPDQTLYLWRGAVNAFDIVEAKTMPLSTSFRFGESVSSLANMVLGKVKLTSLEGLVTEVGEDVVDKNKPYTVLYRCNATLVLDAVKAISAGEDTVNLEIDLRDFCKLLESANALYNGEVEKVKHEEILAFGVWNDLVLEAESNPNMKRVVSLVESKSAYKVIRTLSNHSNVEDPHIVMTTAHKSKGREWDQVVLADDFPRNFRNNKWVGLSDGEKKVLYVACTRGRKALNVNNTVQEIKYHCQSEVTSTLPAGIKVSFLGKNIPKVYCDNIIDTEYNGDHKVAAYESFLDEDRQEDEEDDNSRWIDGSCRMMPELRSKVAWYDTHFRP